MECWQSIQEWNVEHFVTCIRTPQHNTMGKHHDILFSTSTTTHQWHQTRWQENLSLLDTVAFTKNDFKFYAILRKFQKIGFTGLLEVKIQVSTTDSNRRNFVRDAQE